MQFSQATIDAIKADPAFAATHDKLASMAPAAALDWSAILQQVLPLILQLLGLFGRKSS